MKTATCTTCGAVVEWPAKICPHCGATIKSFKNMVGCRVCDNPVAKNANKCPHCGAHTPNKNNFIAGILAIVFVGVWFIVTILSLGPSDTSDDTKQAAATPKVSQSAEMTDGEKASALLYEASTEFQNGDYMSAIELCDQITSEYPNTDLAAGMPEWLANQFAQFPQYSAPDLMAEYDANIVNADEKYTDTVMVVSGTVNSIGKINNDKTLAVMLDSNAYFSGVQLNFKTSQTEAIAALSEGDHITAIGRCTGISGTNFIVFSGDNVMIENCYILD